MKTSLYALALSSLICLGGGSAAQACAFHGYTPNPTLVDLLLNTEQVVLARLAPNDPNRFVPAETLMGPDVADIPIPVSATSRAALRNGGSTAVLLVRDGSYGPWQEVGLINDRSRVVIDAVLQRQSAWLFGGDADRLAVFVGLVNDPDTMIRQLALRELDRAPYSALKAARVPNVQGLAQDLNGGDADLTPIRVLLAGLSKDPSFVPQLAAGLDQAVKTELAYTGAYATALIELAGPQGVAHIRDRYLQNASLPAVTRDRLLQALAIQYRSADGATRQSIVKEVATLSRSVPGFREAAARQFGFENL